MPLYNPADETKQCSKCQEVTTGRAAVDAAYFKVKAMKDGYATRCKKCYYVKATIAEVVERSDRQIERKLTKMQEAEPIKERPASQKAYTHTPKEIKALEQSTGLKFTQWVDMGDCWMPQLGKAAT